MLKKQTYLIHKIKNNDKPNRLGCKSNYKLTTCKCNSNLYEINLFLSLSLSSASDCCPLLGVAVSHAMKIWVSWSGHNPVDLFISWEHVTHSAAVSVTDCQPVLHQSCPAWTPLLEKHF